MNFVHASGIVTMRFHPNSKRTMRTFESAGAIPQAPQGRSNGLSRS